MTASLGEAILELTTDNKGLTDGLDAGEGKAQAFAKHAALAIAGVGVAVAGIGAALYSVGSSFDSAFDGIRIGTGATGDALAGLEDDFRAVAAAIPVSFEDASAAIAELHTRTGATGKTLQDLSANVLELSRITGTNAKTNIAAATRLFGDWSIATDQQAATLDKVFRASQATGIGVSDLMQKVVQFGAPLRQMGFSFEASIAMLGKWEKEGVNAELVLGSLRIAAGKFADAGVPLQKGLQDTMAAIRGTKDESAALSMAMETFGARAGPDMAAAIREGRFELGDLLATIKDGDDTIIGLGEETSDLGERWQKAMNRMTLAVEPLASRVFSLAGTVVDRLAPVLENLFKVIGDLADVFMGAEGAGLKLHNTLETLLGSDIANFLIRIVQGAQKLLDKLGALKDSFGDLFATGDFGVFADDLREAFGIDLTPFINAFAKLAPTGERVAKMLDALLAGVKSLIPSPVLDMVQGLADGTKKSTLLSDALDLIVTAVNAVSEGIETATKFISEHKSAQAALVGILTAAVTAWTLMKAAAIAHSAIVAIQTTLTGALTAAQAALNLVMSANPIGLVIIAIAGLAAGIIYLYNNSEEFRTLVDQLATTLGTFASDTLQKAGDTVKWVGDRFTDLKNAISGVLTWVKDHWPEIATIISGPFAPLVALATDAFGIRSKLLGAFDGMKTGVTKTQTAISDFLIDQWDKIPPDIQKDLKLIGDNLKQRWDSTLADTTEWLTGTQNKIDSTWGDVRTSTNTAWSAVASTIGTSLTNADRNYVTPLLGSIQGAVSTAWNTVQGATGSAWSGVTGVTVTIGNALSDALGRVTDFGGDLAAKAGQMIEGVKSAFEGVGRAIIDGIWAGVQAGWNWLSDRIGDLARALLDAAKGALGIGSPSKEFALIGRYSMEGIDAGMRQAAAGVQATVVNVTNALLRSGEEGATINRHSDTRNNTYNLTVNTNAPTSTVIEDFALLRALAGA